MTINDLKTKKPELFAEVSFQECKISEIKNKENAEKFKYRGVYILTDEKNEIVYIGSAYVRNVRSRLLQYQLPKGTGNSTLYSDLIEGNKCKEEDAEEYIKSLTAHAFSNESLEYQLIKETDSAVNIAGK